MEPRLQRAEQVHLEMESLSREFHLLGEICQQQKDQIISLQSQSQHSWEWRTKCALLHKEKEEGLRKIHGLEQALGACQARLKELEREGSCKELEISELRVHLEEERACAWNKMKVRIMIYVSLQIMIGLLGFGREICIHEDNKSAVGVTHHGTQGSCTSSSQKDTR